MAIIVEDGTGVAGANSYISLPDAIAQAAQFGLSAAGMSEDDLIKGMSEVHKYGLQFKGYRTNTTQSTLADWPRTDAVVYAGLLDPDTIPQQAIDAQVIAAASITNGAVTYGVDSGRAVASEAVEGAVSVSYFNNGVTSTAVNVEQTKDILRPLLTGQSGLVLMR